MKKQLNLEAITRAPAETKPSCQLLHELCAVQGGSAKLNYDLVEEQVLLSDEPRHAGLPGCLSGIVLTHKTHRTLLHTELSTSEQPSIMFCVLAVRC